MGLEWDCHGSMHTYRVIVNTVQLKSARTDHSRWNVHLRLQEASPRADKLSDPKYRCSIELDKNLSHKLETSAFIVSKGWIPQNTVCVAVT
jgi:hypothetical protein